MKARLLISARDAELFLERSVRSALARDWLDIALMVDPGSKDDTRQVASELVHEFPRRVRFVGSTHEFLASNPNDWWSCLAAHDFVVGDVRAHLERSTATALVGRTERRPLSSTPTRASIWWRGATAPSAEEVPRLESPANLAAALVRQSVEWLPATIAATTPSSPRRPLAPGLERALLLVGELEGVCRLCPRGASCELRTVMTAQLEGLLHDLESPLLEAPALTRARLLHQVSRGLRTARRCGLEPLDARLAGRLGRWSSFTQSLARPLARALHVPLRRARRVWSRATTPAT
jgi:hypothetical protein